MTNRLHFILRNPTGDAPRAERMWVEVTTALDREDRYRGVLTNVPAFITGLHQGEQPSLDFFIREPVGAVFERRPDHAPWVRVTDWSPA